MSLAFVPTPDSLTERFDATMADIAASEAKLAGIVAEIGATEAWKADNMRSLADWVLYRGSVSRATARRYARAAAVVPTRPIVAAALAASDLSLDQAMPLCERLDAEEASTKKEARAVESAAVTPAYVLEREARLACHRDRDDDDDADKLPVLHLRRDLRTGRWRIWGTLDDAEGAAINQALRRRAAKFGPDPETGKYAPIATRVAMALYEVCASAIAADPDPDRATVVLFSKGPVAELVFGPTISNETRDRLLCDAREQIVWTDDDGEPNGIEDVTQTVPWWLRRLVYHRDSGCRWPGCGRTDTLLHVHHIVFRSRGGPTVLWNLVLLCHAHHKAVHEGKFAIRGDPGDQLMFLRPDGTPIELPRPAPWADAYDKFRDKHPNSGNDPPTA